MAVKLTPEQRRVLGVLIEKSLATPEYYPMTLNAVLAACNQKSNREPVVNYGESEVGRALHDLTQMNLVAHGETVHGARSNRFEQHAHEELGWNRRHRAVMAELLLRGPQTAGELRARTARMVPLPDAASVASVLDELADMDPPQIRALPREPGRSAIRFDHLLYPADETPAGPAIAAPDARVDAPRGAPAATAPVHDLSCRVERLESEVDALRTVVDELHRRVGNLDGGSTT